MLEGLLLAAAIVASPEQSVQSKNGEFIFNKCPPRALAAGEQGPVRFQAKVNKKGVVLGCKVTEGSGFERLDRETCDLIVNHATFKPVLDSEGRPRAAVHYGVVHWRIPGAAAPAKVAAINGRSPDETVCKRILKTGSLVSRSRACMTRREWNKYADESRDHVGEIQRRDHAQRN